MQVRGCSGSWCKGQRACSDRFRGSKLRWGPGSERSGEAEAFVQSGPAGQAEAEGFSRGPHRTSFQPEAFLGSGVAECWFWLSFEPSHVGTLREFRGCSRCWEWSLIFILGRIEVSSCSVGQRTLLGNREVKWPDSVSLRRQAKAAPERSSVQLRGRTAAQTSASGLAPPRVLHVKVARQRLLIT